MTFQIQYSIFNIHVNYYRAFVTSILLINSSFIYSQNTVQTVLSMKDATELALKNSLQLRNAELLIQQAILEKRTSFEPGNTELNYKNGQIYGIDNSQSFEIKQNFGSIPKHIQNLKKAKISLQLKNNQYELIKKQLIAEVKSAYVYWEYATQIEKICYEEQMLYEQLEEIAELKYKTGEISLMTKALLISQQSEIRSQYLISADELAIAENKLKQYLLIDGHFKPSIEEPELYWIDRTSEIAKYSGNIFIELQTESYNLAKKEVDLKKAEYFPEIIAGGFLQNIGASSGLYGWQFGLSVPLWIPKQNAEIKKASINANIKANELIEQKNEIAFDIENLLFELNKYFHQVNHFNETALDEAATILSTASQQLQNEEIEYSEFVKSISVAYQIKRQYYLSVLNYNRTAIQLEIYAE